MIFDYSLIRESLSAKELFHSCNKYGHIVDTFIPTKRSKAARFHRTPVNGVKNLSKDAGGIKSNNMYSKTKDDRIMNANGTNGGGNSYVRVVKGQLQSGGGDIESVPAVVLDDECLLSKDLSKSLLGRVKEFV
ncbi:hypothetical protein Tco_0323161 [Tanacetum coccineum]